MAKRFGNFSFLLALMIALLLALTFGALRSGRAEEAALEQERAGALKYSPHFVHTAYYPGEGVRGMVEVFSDTPQLYVRITVFGVNQLFFVNVAPVTDGDFQLQTDTLAKYVALQLVDRPDVYEPWDFYVYDALLLDYSGEGYD